MTWKRGLSVTGWPWLPEMAVTHTVGMARSMLILRLVALALGCLAMSGCSTYTTFQSFGPGGTRTPDSYPIPIFTPDQTLPRPVSVIGIVAVRHTPVTIFGGTVVSEMSKIMKKAHAVGADEVQVLSLQAPGFDTPDFSIQARLLRYAAPWENLAISEQNFRDYLAKNRQSLDPIEGIWTDGLPHRLGIIRASQSPGRDFVAFTLTPDQPNWKPGDKKMDIARVSAGNYQIKYYRDDFCSSDLEVNLEQGKRIHFILVVGDQSCLITLKKLEPTEAP